MVAGCSASPTSIAHATKSSGPVNHQQVAFEGELYFNLHTTGHTYFGDIRGQLHRIDP